MGETRERGVLATTEGVQKLKVARSAKRNNKGKPWTYADIAMAAGIDEKTVGRVFRREQRVDESSACAICQVLSVNVNEVFDFNLRFEDEDRKGQLGNTPINRKNLSLMLTPPTSVAKKQKANQIVIKLEGIDLEAFLSDKEIQAAVTLLFQKASGDASLKIEKVEEGSIKITLSGSPEGIEQLAALIQSGELSEVLGFSVEDVQLIDSDTKNEDENTDANIYLEARYSHIKNQEEKLKELALLAQRYPHATNEDENTDANIDLDDRYSHIKNQEEKLKELALLAQRHPHATKERRIALAQLIDAIWRSGKLCRPYVGQFNLLYEDIYDEAVQNLFLYLCEDDNINKYDPNHSKVMTWVNMLLIKRFFPEAIPKIIGVFKVE